MTPFPVRVLMISNDPSVFQEGSEVRARLKEYAAHVEQLHVLSRGSNEEFFDGNLMLHGAGRSRFWSKFSLVKKAERITKEYSIQVISAQDPFEHGRAAYLVAESTGAKLHVQVHTDFLSPFFAKESFRNRVRVRIADTVLPNADGIRVVSERIKKSLVDRYGDAIVPPAVLPIAVPQDDAPAAALPEDMPQFRLIAVSRLEEEKRLKDVLLAVSRVRVQYPAVGLAIVGDGSLRKKLMSYARRLGIQKNVWFLGSRTDARGLMKSATAFIQASAYEGYGRTLIEAALAHIPVITTDVGIVGEVLTSDTSALVCPVGDVVCLERQLRSIIKDNALRSSLVLAARNSVVEHLASNDYAEALVGGIVSTIKTP